MRSIRDWLTSKETHEGMSMVVLHTITHGTKEGILCSVENDGQGLLTSDLIGSICDLDILRGKPKLFFINACRGGRIAIFLLFTLCVTCKIVS